MWWCCATSRWARAFRASVIKVFFWFGRGVRDGGSWAHARAPRWAGARLSTARCPSHPPVRAALQAGSAEKAAAAASIPVINAGDGPGQHPTQVG